MGDGSGKVPLYLRSSSARMRQGQTFVQLTEECRDVCQDTHGTSVFGLSELTKKACTAAGLIDPVKKLKLAKTPE